VYQYYSLQKNQEAMTQKSILINGSQVYYAVTGQGIPVVLLHGFGEDEDVWRYQVPALAAQYQLIVPTLPGTGRSGAIDDMSMEGMAACIKQIIDQELPNQKDQEGIIMIGHSMGGYITLAFAEKFPGYLKAFGLFHSSAFPDSEEKKAARRKSIGFIQKNGSHEFIQQSAPNLFTPAYRIENSGILADMIARYSNLEPASLIAYYEAMMQRPDRTSVLQSFNKPVLFIIGKHDAAIPFEDSMKQCHLPMLSTVEILEKSAHMGMWEEKEKSSQALLLFLEQAQQFTLH
jgi:pimeloyl-ACP methyl ester carboxylesterase